jgi:hypothetical protein
LYSLRHHAWSGIQTLDGGSDFLLKREAGNDFQARFELKLIEDHDILGLCHGNDQRLSTELNGNTLMQPRHGKRDHS